MLNVYYTDKVLTFADNYEPLPDGADTVSLATEDTVENAKLLEKLENSKHLYIKTDNPKRRLEEFYKGFEAVDAAGGVVSDAAGDILMIVRNGRYDLPKGHRESGESMEECALREVREETGIEELQIGRHIIDTRHFYSLDGRMIMKRTAWYAMTGEQSTFTPQTEEGITLVEWVRPAEVAAKSEGSYSAIKAVLRESGVLIGNV
jgi:8-oxo-dGTP pyrophosphatase MutT (NUDIX family)